MGDGSEKSIEEVKIGDEVITHTGNKRKVLNTFNRFFTGELITIQPKGFPFPLSMTDNHPVAVMTGSCSWRWQPGDFIWKNANDVEINDRILIGYTRNDKSEEILDLANYFGKNVICLDDLMNGKVEFSSETNTKQAIDRCKKVDWKNRIKFPQSAYNKAIFRYIPICPSFARLIGLYLAEGCCTTKRVIFNLAAYEENLAGEILALVKGLFGTTGKTKIVNKRKTGRVVIFGNVNLVRFFKSFAPGSAITKRVPAIFFNCNENIKTALLTGWLDGDGHKRVRSSKKPHLVVSGGIASVGLARDLVIIGFLLA